MATHPKHSLKTLKPQNFNAHTNPTAIGHQIAELTDCYRVLDKEVRELHILVDSLIYHLKHTRKERAA